MKRLLNMPGLMDFESRDERAVFMVIAGMVVIMLAVVLYPALRASAEGVLEENAPGKGALAGDDERAAGASIGGFSKSPEEYYKMFKCSCCGSAIDRGCCGMAKQRKAYADKLILKGLSEDEIVYEMVKQFGFDVLMNDSMEQDVKDYIKSIAPENPPKIYIENPIYDFGTVRQSEGVVSAKFTLKNTGMSDLVIENMDTSCMCTSATLIYGGVESPRFGMSMHGGNPENFELRIPPGDTAQLVVYYDPMAHGVQKRAEMRITREVTIISNDPSDFQKKVRIELTQVL